MQEFNRNNYGEGEGFAHCGLVRSTCAILGQDLEPNCGKLDSDGLGILCT